MTAIEQARGVAELSHQPEGARKAVTAMQHDLQNVSASDRREYFNELARLDKTNHLPGFEITGDERSHDRRVALTGQRALYEENANITRNQGPYCLWKSGIFN